MLEVVSMRRIQMRWERVTKGFKHDYHHGACSVVVLFATRRIVVPHMFRVGLMEESTMRILEAADFDLASTKPSCSFGTGREMDCREMS